MALMPRGVSQWLVLIDFDNYSSSTFPSIGQSKNFINVLSHHYPERLGKTFMIRSPWIFYPAFKVVSGFLDPKTSSKIAFAGEKANDEGRQLIQAMLPAEHTERRLHPEGQVVVELSPAPANKAEQGHSGSIPRFDINLHLDRILSLLHAIY